MHILVARPEPGAGETARALETMGHSAIIAPLMEVRLRPEAVPPLTGMAALIATSRNGVRALEASPQFETARALPLYAVGQATGEAARKAGIANVIEGPSDGAALARLIAERQPVDAGPLVHLAGEALAYDVKGALETLGFTVVQPVVYATRPAVRFAPEIEDALRMGCIGAVVLMSPRTAETYAALITKAGLTEAARSIACLCLSRGVAERVASLSPERILVAEAPNAPSLEALAGRL